MHTHRHACLHVFACIALRARMHMCERTHTLACTNAHLQSRPGAVICTLARTYIRADACLQAVATSTQVCTPVPSRLHFSKLVGTHAHTRKRAHSRALLCTDAHAPTQSACTEHAFKLAKHPLGCVLDGMFDAHLMMETPHQAGLLTEARDQRARGSRAPHRAFACRAAPDAPRTQAHAVGSGGARRARSDGGGAAKIRARCRGRADRRGLKGGAGAHVRGTHASSGYRRGDMRSAGWP
jgi:hypothetical protein